MKKITIKSVISGIVFILDMILLFVEPLSEKTIDTLPELKLICIMVGVLSLFYCISALDREDQAKTLSKNAKLQIESIRSIIGVFHDTKSFAELNEVEKKHGLDSNTNGNMVYIITSCLQEANDRNPVGRELLKTIRSNIIKHNVEYYYIIPIKLKEDFETFIKLLKGQKKITTNKVYVSFDEKMDILFPSEYFDVNIYVDTMKKDGTPMKSTAEGYYCFSSKSDNDAYLYYKMKDEKAKEFLKYMETQEFITYVF